MSFVKILGHSFLSLVDNFTKPFYGIVFVSAFSLTKWVVCHNVTVIPSRCAGRTDD